MDDNFYVQVVRQDGGLGSLYGPGTWDACIEKVKRLLAAGGVEAVTLTADEAENIESEGAYEFADGGGIYTICSESLDQE